MDISFSLHFLSLTVKCGGLYVTLLQCGLPTVSHGGSCVLNERYFACSWQVLQHRNSCSPDIEASQNLVILHSYCCLPLEGLKSLH